MSTAGKETWKNATLGRVAVAKIDRRGDIDHELVSGGGKILLTTDERIMNQEMAANDELDVFKNGTMVPVRLLDTTEDAAEIASNPNLKSEEDLRNMFKLQWKKFETECATLSNLTTLLRLKEIAQEGDATVRQVNVIEARIAEVDPNAVVVDTTIQNYGSVAPEGIRTPVR